MEHNSTLNSLPQEVNEFIFSYVSIADLFSLYLVSKEIQAKLINPRTWREACLRSFDLEFIDENSNWRELASKYSAINYNIRKARALVQACALSVLDDTCIFTRESYAKDPSHLVVNWRRSINEGEDLEDYHDHAVILNIDTRQEEQMVRSIPPERSLVVIGDRLAEHNKYRNGYNEHSYYEVTAVSEVPGHKLLKKSLPGQCIRKVVSNSDPQLQHLIVIVDAPRLHVYDMNETRIVKSFRVDNLPVREDWSREPNVIFHGNFVYALPEGASVLHCFDITNSHEDSEQVPLPIDARHWTTLRSAHKSFVFGSTRDSPAHRELAWAFDLMTAQFKTYSEHTIGGIFCMTVYCGVLAVVTGEYISFVDYRTVLSTLQLRESFQPTLHVMKDGRLLSSGEYCNSAALIDFEHVLNTCEILLVEKTKEQKSTPIAIKAHELVSRASAWLGTHKLVSRYFKMNSQQRFGIIYCADQGQTSAAGKKKRNLIQKAIDVVSQVKNYIVSYVYGSQELTLHNMEGIMDVKPEYNTPYMYYNMVPGTANAEYIAWTVPKPVKQFYGKVIIFYEEFDGTRWKLSKPQHWITEKLI